MQKARPVDEDQQWVERCQAGDLDAFEPLVKQHYERAVRIAYGVVRRQEDAVDVAQNAFLKAYQKISDFSGRSRFSTWLYRIVFNQALDYKRKRDRRKVVSLDTSEEDGQHPREPAALVDSAENPREAAYAGEMEAQLERALETLSEEHRQVLILREVQGLSYEEIAEIAQCPLGTVMSRLHHARRALRETLAQWL